MNTDLIIYVTGDPDQDEDFGCANVMGFAGYCQSNAYNRPIAGYINLCRNSIDSQSVLTWEQSLALILHQSFHILGVYILCQYSQISHQNHHLHRF